MICLPKLNFFNRKKKKDKEKKKLVEVNKIINEEGAPKIEVRKTKAELAFKERLEKNVNNFLVICLS